MLQQSLFIDVPSVIRRAIAAMLVIIALGLVGIRIAAIFEPPSLVVERPTDLLSTSSRFVTVTGTTEPGTTLTINGLQLVPDTAGAFSTEVILAPGANTIAIEARRRHSRAAQVIRRIQVHAANAPLA